MSVQAMEDASP